MKCEMRQNKANGEWVIFAPRRGRRPSDFKSGKGHPRQDAPRRDPDCPFCPGNERSLPRVIAQAGSGKRWRTRVVLNKFPALDASAVLAIRPAGPYLRTDGYGRHEVIIETPRHDRDPARMSARELRAVVEAYHETYTRLMKDPRNMLVLIFRNHGEAAGTSLKHPHSQAIATGLVPGHVRAAGHEAQRFFDQHGACAFCETLKFEKRQKRRLLFVNRHFLCFVPYAAEVPCELWIVPRRHAASFGDTTAPERVALATVLGRALSVLRERLGDPDYNYVIMSAPRHREDEPHLHWYLRIRPRLTTRAGFEIGSGMLINPSLPETDRDFLKGRS